MKNFLVAHMVKNLPAMWETWIWSLGLEEPVEKEMATHSSILAWIIPWTEEPGRLQSMGSQGVGHNWATNIYIYAVWGCYCPWIWDTIHLTMTRDTYLTATICLPILHIKWGNPSIKCNKFFLARSKHRPFLKRLCWNINSTYLRWPPLKWI